MTITWGDVPTADQQGSINGYIVFYREKLLGSSYYNTIGSYNHSCEIIGLTPWTEYVFRLLAYTATGNGVASRQITARTLETCK